MFRGDRLKQLREAKGMTQNDLGHLVNITKVSICGYEKGNRTPNLDTLSDICDVLATTPSYLMGIEVSIVSEDNNEYGYKMSSDEVLIMKELRQNRELYTKLLNDTRRTIELINSKIK